MATRREIDPSAVVVRRAERADLLAVSRIEQAVFAQPWSSSAFEGFLGEPTFLVATLDGEVVGYVVADVTPNYGRDVGHVKDLAVRPDVQGNGIGRTLLQRAVLGVTIAGATVITLEVRRSNERAISLYRDEGFEPVRRFPGYYDDGECALVLQKRVSSPSG